MRKDRIFEGSFKDNKFLQSGQFPRQSFQLGVSIKESGYLGYDMLSLQSNHSIVNKNQPSRSELLSVCVCQLPIAPQEKFLRIWNH